jgi:predicted transcriptional regulator
VARITVSLTDSLKSKLDAYAEEQKLSVSRVVSQALQAFLPGEENPPDPDLVNTQRYIAQLVHQLEGLREAVHRMALAQYGPFADLPDDLTQSLPASPWTLAADVEEQDEE